MQDLGLNSLKSRREMHRIKFFHHLYAGGSTPTYVRAILPDTRYHAVNRTLRTSRQRTEIAFRTVNFSHSFLPSVIKSFNKLPNQMKEINSHNVFAKHLKEHFKVNQPPLYYSLGSKMQNSLLTHLRLGISKLNAHAYQIQKSDSPSCLCGHQNENTEHYFLQCPRFDHQRIIMENSISTILNSAFRNMHRKNKIDILTHGQNIPPDKVRAVAQAVFQFVNGTKRFFVNN